MATLIASALVTVACGGGSPSTPSPPTTTPPPAGGGTSGPTATIAIPAGDGYGNSSFAPGTLTVTPGTTVTWSNRDTVTHNTSSGTTWNATMEPGGSFSRTFADRGTFSYRCSIHAGMSGTITVQ